MQVNTILSHLQSYNQVTLYAHTMDNQQQLDDDQKYTLDCVRLFLIPFVGKPEFFHTNDQGRLFILLNFSLALTKTNGWSFPLNISIT